MGAGFLGLLAGGFIGYHWATHHGNESKCASWGNYEGRQHGWGRRWQQPVPVTEASYPSQAPTTPAPQASSGGAPGSVSAGIEPHEFALFQQWKQQSQASQPRSSFPAIQQQPPNYDAMKAGAVESADKALDAILSQVQSMKERLAQHRGNFERSAPSTPKTEAGDFKLV